MATMKCSIAKACLHVRVQIQNVRKKSHVKAWTRLVLHLDSKNSTHCRKRELLMSKYSRLLVSRLWRYELGHIREELQNQP